MKIVYITTYPPRGEIHANTGGVASYAKNLINNTPFTSQDEVYVLCDKANGKLVRYDENGKHILQCFDKDARFIYQILREISTIDPDIVHIQQELALYGNIISAFLLQVLLLFLLNRKTVITLHGVVSLKKITKEFVAENYYRFPPFAAKLGIFMIFKPLTMWAQKIIVHEEHFKKILMKEYNVPKDKIVVIPHGVDELSSLPQMKARKALSLPLKKHIILFLGYFTGYKGLDLLIEGFADYVRVDKDAMLLIGAGMHPKLQKNENYRKLYDSFVAKVAKQIPDKKYRWLGFVSEKQLPLVISASNITVFPYTVGMSSSGPLSLSIAYKIPILVSRPIADTLGSLFPYFNRDSVSLVYELRSFFSSKKKKGISQLNTVRKKRLWTTVGKKHYYLYRS